MASDDLEKVLERSSSKDRRPDAFNEPGPEQHSVVGGKSGRDARYRQEGGPKDGHPPRSPPITGHSAENTEGESGNCEPGDEGTGGRIGNTELECVQRKNRGHQCEAGHYEADSYRDDPDLAGDG